MTSYEKGIKGEQIALAYLEKKGYKLMDTRYSTHYGEVDLIVKKEDVIVFVEVKYRHKGQKGKGVITNKKQKRNKILLTIQQYLLDHGLVDTALRVDVIEISNNDLWHIENAFS